MSAKHTPGPWKLGAGRSENGCEAYVSSTLADSPEQWEQLARVVVRMGGDKEDDPIGVANAKLIAAAPALADALEWMLNDDSGEARDASEAALRAAGRID